MGDVLQAQQAHNPLVSFQTQTRAVYGKQLTQGGFNKLDRRVLGDAPCITARQSCCVSCS